MADYRMEKDSMGEMQIPSRYLYGASTQRAVENFPVSPLRFSRDFIRMLAVLKATSAEVNEKLGDLDSKLAGAIVDAAKKIAEGEYDAHFVVDIFQTGSGTSTNMNFNEVAANVANTTLGSKVGSKSPVHPNDHVNMGQSSNDVIPTVIHMSAAMAIHEQLLPALQQLREGLAAKAKQFSGLVKTGRTHLQDATPLTLGQEFSGYETQVKKGIERLERVLPSLCELAIGGTAVGTGINTDPTFGRQVSERLAKQLGLPFKEAENHFEAQACKDACVEASGALKTVAVSLTKVANDIRWLGCGPRCGFAELLIPEVQPGSSIMPGKVNPVIAESLLQVCAHVVGNDAAIAFGGAAGNFELNVMMPVIAHNLLESIIFLANAVKMFEAKCVRGIEANSDKINSLVEQGLMLATSLAPKIGYDNAAAIAKTAYKQNKTIREVAKEMTDLSESELKELLDPAKMVQ
ncbi:MAG: class II fumarate hydratase [Bdellovibrionales bacterium]|nr:class II fumarate hydratase [Bdellovibrionales bacterium]